MIEGADRDQGIPKAMGGPGFLPSGFLPSFPPSSIKGLIACSLLYGKFNFTRLNFSVNKIF
jgi:hypothetical protein